jgi:hypothetical protein
VRAPKDGDATEPPGGWDAPDSKERLPGVGTGWDYAPGANADTELLHGLRDSKSARNQGLDESFWRALPAHLLDAETYLDTVDRALVLLVDRGARADKVVVRVNYSERVRDAGERHRITGNFIRTGNGVARENVEDDPRYVRLER